MTFDLSPSRRTMLAGAGVIKVIDRVGNIAYIPGQGFHMDTEISTYTWDGTLNDAGERRMRWDANPKPMQV